MNSDHVNPNERDMSGLLLSEAQLGLPGHLGGIRLLEFTTDCRRFLSADLSMAIQVFENEERIASSYLPSSNYKASAQDRVHDAVFSDDGELFFVAAGLYVRCIDSRHGVEMWSHRPKDLFGFLQTSPRAIGSTFSGDVFVCNDSGTMELWSRFGERKLRRSANDTPLMLAKLHDEQHFVGSDGYGLTVWDPTTLRRTMRVKWTHVHIYGLAASPVSLTVAARTNGVIGIFDLEKQELVSGIQIKPGLPILEFSPDGKNLLVGQGGGVALFDLDGNELDSISYMDDRVLSAKFNRVTGEIYLGLASGEIDKVEMS